MKFLNSIWEKWKIFGHKIGNFQARLILGLFYFVVICPFAAVVRFISKPLRLKILNTSNWRAEKEEPGDIMSRARRQF
jgi:saxitoxin biosynthesis operon SxtJ-like protein